MDIEHYKFITLSGRYVKRTFLYCVSRNSLKCRPRSELAVSQTETILVELTLPNNKPILICTMYRPSNALSEWINLFEEELYIAQTTGFEHPDGRF